MPEVTTDQSTFERFARIIVGGIFLLLTTYVPMNAVLSWILIVVGMILMLTGLAGSYSLNAALRVTTKK